MAIFVFLLLFYFPLYWRIGLPIPVIIRHDPGFLFGIIFEVDAAQGIPHVDIVYLPVAVTDMTDPQLCGHCGVVKPDFPAVFLLLG